MHRRSRHFGPRRRTRRTPRTPAACDGDGHEPAEDHDADHGGGPPVPVVTPARLPANWSEGQALADAVAEVDAEVLMIGGRLEVEAFLYPASEVADRYGASAREDTTEPDDA